MFRRVPYLPRATAQSSRPPANASTRESKRTCSPSLSLSHSHSLSRSPSPSLCLSLSSTLTHTHTNAHTVSRSLSLIYSISHSVSISFTPSHSISYNLCYSLSISLCLTLYCSLSLSPLPFSHTSPRAAPSLLPSLCFFIRLVATGGPALADYNLGSQSFSIYLREKPPPHPHTPPVPRARRSLTRPPPSIQTHRNSSDPLRPPRLPAFSIGPKFRSRGPETKKEILWQGKRLSWKRRTGLYYCLGLCHR